MPPPARSHASGGRFVRPDPCPTAPRGWKLERTRRWGRAVGTSSHLEGLNGGKPEGARGGGAGPARPDPQRRARRSRGRGQDALVEALLLGTGAITRLGRVEDGSTVCDHEDVEHRLGRSVSLAVASVLHEGVRVTFVDTPGHPDFVGEVRAGLRAADAALFVVSAVDGVDGMTRMLWEECAAVGMPRAVVVTHLDQQRGDFDEALANCQRVFGAGVQPLYLPLLGDERGAGRADRAAVAAASSTTPAGARVERDGRRRAPGAHRGRPGRADRGDHQESEDDGLLDRWLARRGGRASTRSSTTWRRRWPAARSTPC